MNDGDRDLWKERALRAERALEEANRMRAEDYEEGKRLRLVVIEERDAAMKNAGIDGFWHKRFRSERERVEELRDAYRGAAQRANLLIDILEYCIQTSDAILADVAEEEKRDDCGDIRTVPLANAIERARATIRELTSNEEMDAPETSS